MIGPDSPTTYDLDEWRAYVRALEAHADYPWRAEQITSAKKRIAIIQKSLAETGQPPDPIEMLRQSAAKMNLPPQKRP